MKGVVIAGGYGTRLFPLTKIQNKHLFPVYDKPMIFYPISTLMSLGIKQICIVTTPSTTQPMQDLLGDGSQIGIEICYKEQPTPKGVADALLCAQDFCKEERFCVILGDNFFLMESQLDQLKKAKFSKGASIVTYHVNNPNEYGVVEFLPSGEIISLEEKPQKPKSTHVVTGLYFYDEEAFEYLSQIKYSDRGELEITNLNKLYLKNKKLSLINLNSDAIWYDLGTYQNLMKAAHYLFTLDQEQDLKVACLEELAYRLNYITKKEFSYCIENLPNSYLKEYLTKLVRT